VTYGDWRIGDQKVCVYDLGRAERELNWKPGIALRDGIGQLVDWVLENKTVFS
jgi:nucleoside-diphosphate-sugar epimerase